MLEETAEADAFLMKQAGGAPHKNVLCPQYAFNKELQVWIPQEAPPSTMYKAVGYNDLKRVTIMMEGDDEEKRAELDLDGMAEPERLERKLKITNLHYRRFFADELENNKALFPNMPFLSVDIKRGQSRGLSKSWFSWGSSDKIDESGQLTTEKVVGYFKGRIKVFNEKDEKKHEKAKKDKME